MNNINLFKKFEKFNDHWSPRIIAELNDQFVKIAKVKGDFVWHHHENEDELFMVIKGTLFIDFRDRTETIGPGEIIVVPKGVEHRPRTNGEEVHIMLIEPKSTLNTGNITNEKTKASLDRI